MELDPLQKKILIPIISALLTGTATYVGQSKKYEPQVERLALSKGKLESTVINQKSEINTLNRTIQDFSHKYKILESDYEILFEKYSKIISSEGVVYRIGSFDFNNYQSKVLRTNDEIEFRVTSGSINVKLLRISDRGPIIKISGLDYYLTYNGIKSPTDGSNCYLLSLNNSFNVKYSSASRNRGNKYIVDGELEVISLEIESYDTDNQTAQIKFIREIGR